MADERLAHPFSIGLIEGGRWLAVSTRTPYFCIEGSSEAEVRETVNRALSFFHGVEGHVVAREDKKAKATVSISSFRCKELIE